MKRLLVVILFYVLQAGAQSYRLENLTWHRTIIDSDEATEMECKNWGKSQDLITKRGTEWVLEYGDRDGHAKLRLLHTDTSRTIFVVHETLFRATISLDAKTRTFVACYEIGNGKSENQFTVYTGTFKEE